MKTYTKTYLPTTLIRIYFSFFMYGIGIIVLGASIFPGVAFLYYLWAQTMAIEIHLRLLYFCFGFVFGYFLSGAMLMSIVSFIRIVFQLQLKEVVIGDNAVIAAGAIVPKDTHVLPNTTFLGNTI